MEFHDIVIQQKSYFDSNSTKSIAFRKIMLKKLMDVLDEREDLLLEALHKDLGKSRGEGYMTEVGMVRSEIKEALINVEAWSHPKKAGIDFHFSSAHRIEIFCISFEWHRTIELFVESCH